MKKRILIVDDEFSILEILKDILTDEGYEVLTAANGRDGLSAFEADRPNLVVMDLMMPIMDGQTMLNGMRQVDGQIPVIVMSAGKSALAEMDAHTEFISKPFEVDFLLQRVSRALGRA